MYARSFRFSYLNQNLVIIYCRYRVYALTKRIFKTWQSYTVGTGYMLLLNESSKLGNHICNGTGYMHLLNESECSTANYTAINVTRTSCLSYLRTVINTLVHSMKLCTSHLTLLLTTSSNVDFAFTHVSQCNNGKYTDNRVRRNGGAKDLKEKLKY
jgi:hypothetical protein